MSIEAEQIPTQDQPVDGEVIYGAANFEELLLRGLSSDCIPCYNSRATYVRAHAVIFSARTRSVPEAILRLEEDILPCSHNYDNADIELAVRGLQGYNKS